MLQIYDPVIRGNTLTYIKVSIDDNSISLKKMVNV